MIPILKALPSKTSTKNNFLYR